MQQEMTQLAHGLRDNLLAVDAIMDNLDELVEYVTEARSAEADLDILDELRGDLLAGIGSERVLEDALNLLDEYGTADERSEWLDGWLEGVLDIEIRGMYSVEGWTVDTVEFVVTLGGPRVSIIWTGSDSVEIHVSWANTTVRCFAISEALDAYALELAEGVTR